MLLEHPKEKQMEKNTTISQYCLEAIPVEKFIQSLTNSIHIYEIQYRGTYRGGAKKLLIPEVLKKQGVKLARSTSEHIDVTGTLRNGVSKEKMLVYIRRVAKSYSIPLNKFNVVKAILMDKKQTCSLTFRRMFKQIKLPDDKRKKKIVVGLIHSNGDKTMQNNLLAKLSAKKITCTLAKTEKTIVMCSEEVVVK